MSGTRGKPNGSVGGECRYRRRKCYRLQYLQCPVYIGPYGVVMPGHYDSGQPQEGYPAYACCYGSLSGDRPEPHTLGHRPDRQSFPLGRCAAPCHFRCIYSPFIRHRQTRRRCSRIQIPETVAGHSHGPCRALRTDIRRQSVREFCHGSSSDARCQRQVHRRYDSGRRHITPGTGHQSRGRPQRTGPTGPRQHPWF